MIEKINAILQFWFQNLNQVSDDNLISIWTESYSAEDQAIKQKFEEIHYLATKGQCDAWLSHPKSCLAFILLMHQFPKRMYRNKPTAYQFHYLAIKAANQGREHKLDKDLNLIERLFFYAPYSDSEALMDQRLGLVLHKQLLEEAEKQQSHLLNFIHKMNQQAANHYEIIQNFGRFPQRNDILERESTQDELLFLKFPNMS